MLGHFDPSNPIHDLKFRIQSMKSTMRHSLDSHTYRVYYTKFFVNVLGRAFKVMKNGVYFIIIAFSVAELFKILVYAN